MYIISISIVTMEFEYQSKICLVLLQNKSWQKNGVQKPWTIHTRVANVVADHNDLLTQWSPIKMSKFRADILLKRTTSNYFWASEVSKNQLF